MKPAKIKSPNQEMVQKLVKLATCIFVTFRV